MSHEWLARTGCGRLWTACEQLLYNPTKQALSPPNECAFQNGTCSGLAYDETGRAPHACGRSVFGLFVTSALRKRRKRRETRRVPVDFLDTTSALHLTRGL